MKFGLPTGKLDLEKPLLAMKDAISRNLRAGADAIEVTALRQDEALPILDAFAAARRFFFVLFVTFHAPSRMTPEGEVELVKVLEGERFCRLPVVLHPDAIHDHALWARLGGRVRIENMDLRKKLGQRVHHLEETFKMLPEARWCFDIGHAFQVDTTGSEAVELLAAFGDRLVEVHVSNVDQKGQHHSMTLESMVNYSRVLAGVEKSGVVIAEVPLADERAMKLDLELVRACFKTSTRGTS
jgi:hypothetical protein